MKVYTQIFLAFLFFLKVGLGSLFFYQIEFAPFSIGPKAIASEVKQAPKETVKEKKEAPKEDRGDLESMAKKKMELREEEERISKKKAELLAIQADISEKMAKLTQMREEIRAELGRREGVEDQKMKHLIKVYSAMKPQSAAALLEKLDLSLAIELLSKMKGEDVGNILSFVSAEKAAKISEGLLRKKQ
jgi:flagellar motility protein MotE (MotC chaperone)